MFLGRDVTAAGETYHYQMVQTHDQLGGKLIEPRVYDCEDVDEAKRAADLKCEARAIIYDCNGREPTPMWVGSGGEWRRC